jgi:hypothetical protein
MFHCKNNCSVCVVLHAGYVQALVKIYLRSSLFHFLIVCYGLPFFANCEALTMKELRSMHIQASPWHIGFSCMKASVPLLQENFKI